MRVRSSTSIAGTASAAGVGVSGLSATTTAQRGDAESQYPNEPGDSFLEMPLGVLLVANRVAVTKKLPPAATGAAGAERNPPHLRVRQLPL